MANWFADEPWGDVESCLDVIKLSDYSEYDVADLLDALLAQTNKKHT